ncbi:uncharacterized protein LOC128737467 [Sabethes cyaneus]|uniref:uncharacterized protein LOC128737467 n=1 Tax=Sabethes cyaneus TaxID=53552 RepID=UPI00237E19A3|nr:uncharacterized protein LOC128737467 [Sabethes cyaneus]
MFSLVADYGDSAEESTKSESSSTENSDSEQQSEPSTAEKRHAQPVLPSASLMLANDKKIIPGGVFSNPFREAEDAKLASLEKHVKMVDTEHETSEQKRKICWSYRKGRCRFGSKCNFAHDSDLILKKELHGSSQLAQPTPEEEAHSSQPDGVLSPLQKQQANKKKRPGLSRNLVPPKKVLKMYQRDKYSGKP